MVNDEDFAETWLHLYAGNTFLGSLNALLHTQQDTRLLEEQG